MSLFVLDASYTLSWCFRDRATPNTDTALRRLEAAADIFRRKLTAERALDIWKELTLLPIRQSTFSLDVPKLLELAVRHNISVYDVCYLQTARLAELPLASNDHDLLEAAALHGVKVMRP